MQKMEKALTSAFKNRIKYNDTIVPVFARYYPKDESPCITISHMSGANLNKTFIYNDSIPLNPNHPLYDSNDPYKKYPQQVRREQYSSTVQLNLWCSLEVEREEINSQIKTIFNLIKADHYTQCMYYNLESKTCNNLNMECEALTSTNGRAFKNQCPNVVTNGYDGIISYYDITKMVTDPEFNQDELDNTIQPVLRTIFRVNFEYYDYYVIGGKPTKAIIVDID